MIDYTHVQKIKESSPLIHNMTNQVVANDVANGLIALGASPIMAYAEEEVADVASTAKALVLNIGTVTPDVAKSMLVAGQAANQHNIPVLLDPVGVGATRFRKQVVKELFSSISFTAIRGNVAEIATLAGVEWKTKGVDAEEGKGSKAEIAKALANEKECVVAISGKEDVLSDGEQTYIISNGHAMMGKITGSGCLLSGLAGAFLATKVDSVLAGLVNAHVYYGIAGEKAAGRVDVKGTGSFRAALIDEISQVSKDEIEKFAKVKEEVQ